MRRLAAALPEQPDFPALLAKQGLAPEIGTVVYVHGINNKPVASVLKCQWDSALFGAAMGDRTRMAYWVNRTRYPVPSSDSCAAKDGLSDLDGGLGIRGLATEDLDSGPELSAPQRQLMASLEQRLLAPREVDQLARQARLATAGVEAQRAMLDHVHATAGDPAQQGVQARGQFAQVERLEQVIVGTGLQAIDTIGDGIAGGEHQYRQGLAFFAQAAQQLEAVFVGQAEVEDHHVELRGLQHCPRIGGVANPVHGQALSGEAGADAGGDQVVVLAEQNVHGGAPGVVWLVLHLGRIKGGLWTFWGGFGGDRSPRGSPPCPSQPQRQFPSFSNTTETKSPFPTTDPETSDPNP